MFRVVQKTGITYDRTHVTSNIWALCISHTYAASSGSWEMRGHERRGRQQGVVKWLYHKGTLVPTSSSICA